MRKKVREFDKKKSGNLTEKVGEFDRKSREIMQYCIIILLKVFKTIRRNFNQRKMPKESAEQYANRKAKERIRKQQERLNETPEEKSKRNEANRIRERNRR